MPNIPSAQAATLAGNPPYGGAITASGAVLRPYYGRETSGDFIKRSTKGPQTRLGLSPPGAVLRA